MFRKPRIAFGDRSLGVLPSRLRVQPREDAESTVAGARIDFRTRRTLPMREATLDGFDAFQNLRRG